MSEGTVDGYPRQVWWNADGKTIVESYTITDMAHGTPLGTAANDQRYGVQGAFLIEAGISSSYHIANFFGLTEWIRQPQRVAKPVPPPRAAIESPSARLIPLVSPITPPAPDLGQVLWPLTTVNRPSSPPPESQGERRRGIDVGSVITRALTAAGLMK
jgi:hypothetical protein